MTLLPTGLETTRLSHSPNPFFLSCTVFIGIYRGIVSDMEANGTFGGGLSVSSPD